MIVYCLGTHCAGTTTLTALISKLWKLKIIYDTVGIVKAEKELKIAQIRSNLFLASSYQIEVFVRQIKLERETEAAGIDVVSDQGPEPLLYTLRHTLIGRQLKKTVLYEEHIERLKRNLVFYIEPHKDLVKGDGRRPDEDVDWGEVQFINGMLFDMLEEHNIDYHPIGSRNPVLRIRNVIRELGPPLLELNVEDFMPEISLPIQNEKSIVTLREKYTVRPSLNGSETDPISK